MWVHTGLTLALLGMLWGEHHEGYYELFHHVAELSLHGVGRFGDCTDGQMDQYHVHCNHCWV